MGSEGEIGEEIQPRTYWRWSKQDFLPEESFQSWSAYQTALSQTHHRFKDRLISRSNDANETVELRKQSENDMKRCLTWWDLIWFGFGSVIGAGIFVLTGQETHDHAGPAIVLSYVASGISAMLSVFCYTEFSVEIPVAGGSFAYLRIELGDFVAFITAGNILLESVVGSAAVSRAWTSYFTSLLNRPSNSLRLHTNLTEGYNLLDPIAVVVLAVAATITMISTRKTSYLNWIASAINNVVILFVLIAGFSHANLSNMKPFMPFGPKGVFQAAAIVYFAYGGFDNIATMAEETKNPSRDIPIGLLGSMSIITVVYCLMALSLPMMQKYTDIDTGAAYSMAFHSVGMTWAKYLVALGALKGMTTVLLVGTLGQARYNTHIARAHMIPPWFALVHPKTGTPTLDICFKFLHCFLFKLECLDRPVIGEHTLYLHDDGSCTSSEKILCDRCHPKTTSLEASCLLGDHYFFLYRDFSLLEIKSQWLDWLCSDSSNLVLRDFGNVSVSTSTEVTKSLGGSTGSLVAILVNRHKYFSYGISEFFCFATNIFLMGSLSSSAFIRFGICTAVMLIYYAFFGLHATYDMAHKKGMPESPEPLKVVNSNSREKAEP